MRRIITRVGSGGLQSGVCVEWRVGEVEEDSGGEERKRKEGRIGEVVCEGRKEDVEGG